MVTCQAQECGSRLTNPLLVTLYLTEEQVAELLTPADAVDASAWRAVPSRTVRATASGSNTERLQ
jgi:hypothetical protein